MRLMRVESSLQSSAISGEQLAGPRGTLLCCRCTVALHDFRNVNSNRCSNIYPRRHPHWWTSVPVKGPRAQLWPQATIGFCADRLICNVCACGISHTLGTECHTSCAARGAWQGVAHMEWWVPACVPLWQSWKGGGWRRMWCLCECGLPLKWWGGEEATAGDEGGADAWTARRGGVMWRRSRHAKLASVTAAHANTLIGAIFIFRSQLAAIRTRFGHHSVIKNICTTWHKLGDAPHLYSLYCCQYDHFSNSLSGDLHTLIAGCITGLTKPLSPDEGH